MADYDLTFQSVSIPTNSGGITVTVEEDSNSDGTVDTTEQVTLSDGVTSYSTSSGAFAGSGQVRLVWSIGPPSDVETTGATVVPADVTVAAQAPSTPQNLRVTQVTDTPDVTLAWDDVSNEDEYRIYRATSPGSTLADYTQVDTVAANTTTYTDTSVSLGTRYYYRVSAANTSGESSGSNEVRAEPNADDLTESIVWDSETEWGYGSFSDTTTDGSGNLELTERNSDLSFSYDISITTGASTDDAEVQVFDSTDTELASARVTGNNSETGTLTVAASNTMPLRLQASGEANDGTGTSDASISDNFGNTVSISTSGAPASDDASYDYTYLESGTWTSPVWDFTSTTTASAVYATSTQPTDTNVDVTVETEGGGSTTTVSVPDGTDTETSIEVGAGDRYQLTLELTTDIVDDSTPTPSVDLAILEAHSPPTNLVLSNTTATSVDLSWTGWGSADAYQVYRSESTPVTSSDTQVADTTNTSVTDSGLENGEQYYYNVQAEYTGE